MHFNSTPRTGFLTAVILSLCLLALNRPLNAQDTNSFDRILSMNSSWFVDFGNLNGDAISDMAGVNGNSNANIEIYHGNGDGTFTLQSTLSGSGEYYGIFLNNLNADDIADIIAVSNISGIVYLSSPAGYVESSLPSTGTFNNLATLFADFNNDGVLDVFIKGHTLINNNNGTFTSKSAIAGNGGAVAVDFNNDNFQDIVMTNPADGTVSFYKGKGDGTFETPMTKTLTVDRAVVHDLNTDGFTDIIFKGFDGTIEILYNDANFLFSQSLSFNVGHDFASALVVFDIDHNGVVDLVTSNDSDIQYRPIMEDGSFGSEANFTVGIGSLRGLLYKDVTGEAFPDMVVMSGFGSTRIYTDKLNAALQFTNTEKVYDAQPMADFFAVSPDNVATIVSYAGMEGAPFEAGNYEVTVAVDDPNYESEPLGGEVSITKKTLTVDVADVSVMQTEPIPAFMLTYTGFIDGEDQSFLEEQPVAAVTATAASAPGQYEIIISGGSDENYAFAYESGVLTITELVVGIAEEIAANVFPNPATDRINITLPRWTFAEMYDMRGRKIVTKSYSAEPVSLASCEPGAYIFRIYFNDGRFVQRKIVVK